VFAPFFSPDVGGIQDDPGDVDEAGVVESVQDRFVQAAPESAARRFPTVRPARSNSTFPAPYRVNVRLTT
jgi:hypothetical protein